MLSPVPEFIAAVIPTTRRSRRTSSTSASPKTCAVLRRHGLRGGDLLWSRLGHDRRRAVGDGLGLGGMPLLHALQSAVLSGSEALALDRRGVDDDGRSASSAARSARAQRPHVMAVDDAHVGPVQLFPQEARRPERLDRLLELRSEAVERRADPAGQRRQLLLDALARVPAARVQPHAVEVPRQRADVGRDRHPVVVEDDHDRRAQATGLVDRLERDAAGHGAVADHRDDLARVGVARGCIASLSPTA